MTGTTRHVIVGHPGKLSAEQLARIEADYDRDVADEAKRAAAEKPAEAEKTETEGEAEK